MVVTDDVVLGTLLDHLKAKASTAYDVWFVCQILHVLISTAYDI